MYAFGDDPNPLPESVAVLEDIMTEYINEMVSPLSSQPCLSHAFPIRRLKEMDGFRLSVS
jgi:Transcription initiation factor IID, 18kD subunit